MPNTDLDKSKVNPGIHKHFDIDKFAPLEKNILDRLSKEWYLTNSGQEFTLGASSFRYFLMKPTSLFSEMFNLDRELVAVFSPYENFEPRTLDAFDYVEAKLPSLRTETVCRVLISLDGNVEQKISRLLKSDPEQPIVIPFTYDDLSNPYDDYFIRNRFRSHFYSRDLFSFLSPLKKDLYFFGRSELIQDIVNRHYSGEHSALFGLRKSGKTSIVFAIERFMASHKGSTLNIDCETPAVHQLTWNELLGYLVNLYKEKHQATCKTTAHQKYQDPKKAADAFETDMLKLYQEINDSTLLIFDEIERISPQTGSSPHWREGDDFVYFWQTLRYFFQRHPHIFTYMLVGTNPSCVEKATFGPHDNPIFSSIPFIYVPSFTYQQTREMVRKLGRYMGLKFDEVIYGKLTDDFGGHPFLIRQICSNINRMCVGKRPKTVDKIIYEQAKTEFLLQSKNYIAMIIQVLQDWYPDEHEMLKLLANGDIETFEMFSKGSNYYTNHLVGYGLININSHGATFNIECVKDYLKDMHKYEKQELTNLEKLEEISGRRNRLEQDFRRLIRNQLKANFGLKKATNKVLYAIPETRRNKLQGYDLNALLDPEQSPLYFIDLKNIITREWAVFENIFDNMQQSSISHILDEINDLRKDAHANKISDDDFTQIRLHFTKLETILKNWFAR